MIIETTACMLYQVQETNNADLAHVWYGQRVKRTASGFEPVAKLRVELVRKAGSRVIA